MMHKNGIEVKMDYGITKLNLNYVLEEVFQPRVIMIIDFALPDVIKVIHIKEVLDMMKILINYAIVGVVQELVGTKLDQLAAANTFQIP